MGITISCCNCESRNKKSEIIVPFDLDSELNDKVNNINFDNKLYKDINPGNSFQEVFELIISIKYYSLLLKFLYPYVLIGKYIQNLEYSELFSLIQKLIEFCLNYKINNKYIDYLKINLDYGTKLTLYEIKNLNLKLINHNDSFKKFFIKIISDLSLISHYIKYEDLKEKEDEYKENYWKNVNIKDEMKTLIYKIDYNLIKLKNELIIIISPLNNEFAGSIKTCEDLNTIENQKTSELIIKLYKEIEVFVNKISHS